MNAPFLSLVVPFHDRVSTLARCIRSVIGQRDIRDWELVLVDDGSTDGSGDCVASFVDPRIVLRVHPANRGVCPARNTGIEAARGEWIVFLDSDDEFAGSHALATIADRARAAGPDLHALWFRCRLDDGRISPNPMPDSAEWDYLGYLRFLEATAGRPRDMIRAVRRSCFDALRYPDSRALEERFHLEFARRFRSRLDPDILRLYHQDAPNQLVRLIDRRRGVADRARSRDRSIELATLLEGHGAALLEHAPRIHRGLARQAAMEAVRGRRLGQALIAARHLARALSSGISGS